MLRKLDKAVIHVKELAKRKEEEPPPDSDYTSDSSDVSTPGKLHLYVTQHK